LEGLEVKEITFSQLNLKNDRFRIDAEFLKKEYFEIERLLINKPFKYLKETDCKIIHPSEIKREFVENGVWFFRTQNLRSLKIEDSNNVFISPEDAILLEKNRIYNGDVLITRTGANYGQTAIYDLQKIAIASSHVFILRNTYFNQFYLAVFFNTKYGKKMIDKGMYGAAQPEIAPYYIENIPIPNYSNLFQSSIESVYKKANDKINYSKDLYIKSEQDLLQALGISNWQPTEETKSIKRFSKSYAISGRLDAEYYQPKFDEVLEVIGKVKHKTLGSIASFKKSIEPGSDAYQTEGIPFIRVSDISKFGISQPEIHLDPKIYNDETLKPKKDTILLSKDGSVGIAYKVEQDLDVITSSALLHLTIKDKEVLPDYLTLVLNSKLTQMQAERDAGGSIIQHWRPDEIKQVLIPILPMDTQKELANQIQQSFKLRQESSKLIDIAKQAVEIAIEQDEQTAMKFIKDNT
jgi:type I restriction enzyme M protein